MDPCRAVRPERRLCLGLIVGAALTLMVLLASASPAAACADWLAVDRGQLGVIGVPTIKSVANGPGDTLVVTADRDSFQLDLEGNLLRDLESGAIRVGDAPYIDDGKLILGRNYYSFETVNGRRVGHPMHAGGISWSHPTVGYSYQGSTWDIQLFNPDGTPNTVFNGTGQIYLDPDRGGINPAYRFEQLQIYPTTADSVLVLGVWRDGIVRGSVLQLIEIEPDGTHTVLAEGRDDEWRIINVSSPRRNQNGWEIEVDEWIFFPAELNRSRSRVIEISPSAGTFTTTEFDPRPARLRADDGRGNTFYVVSGGFQILNEDGNHPMMSGARRGEETEAQYGVQGVVALSTGEWAVSIRPPQLVSDQPHGVYVLRGSRSPDHFVVGSLSGEVTRLYAAALGRQPDGEGLRYFARLRGSGAELRSLADSLLQSDEFRVHYGNLDNRRFVEQLYRFVLGREGEENGIAYWQEELAAGRVDRTELLVLFAESPENIIRTDTLPPFSLEGEVYRLYKAVFLRAPDSDGHCYWWHARADGVSLAEVADVFVQSVEFQNRYGALDDRAFVDQLYHNVLNRPADQAGLDHWVSQLTSGATRGQVAVGFSQSVEFRLATDT